MKLLHTSDWHLGMNFGMFSLHDDQKNFIQQIMHIIEKYQVDAVLLSGDVYDTSVANKDAIDLYNEAVTGICGQLGVPMLVIAGNHDGAARLAACHKLLEQSGLFVSGRVSESITPVTIKDVNFYCIPYFNTEEIRAIYPEQKEEIHTYEQAMGVVCDKIRETMERTKKNIILSHSFVVGASLSDSDRSAKVGTATAVSKDVFREFDYVALGHIHRPQDITGQVRYSGSPLVYSFGKEEETQKSVTLLDTETMEQQQIMIQPLHAVRTVGGTFEEIMEQPTTEDFLKIEVTDRYVGLESIALLREHFPQAVEIQGKTYEQEESGSRMSVSEITAMTEEEIVQSFFREMYDYEPNEEQMALMEGISRGEEKQ